MSTLALPLPAYAASRPRAAAAPSGRPAGTALPPPGSFAIRGLRDTPVAKGRNGQAGPGARTGNEESGAPPAPEFPRHTPAEEPSPSQPGPRRADGTGRHGPDAEDGSRSAAAFVGRWQYDASLTGTFGFAPDVDVEPDDQADAPAAATHFCRARAALQADVRFPADVPDAGSPAALSAVQPCPVLLVLSHEPLPLSATLAVAERLAAHGFIAAHLRLPGALTAFERADLLFEHLLVIDRVFPRERRGAIGLLGLGPGADSVFEMARLNRELVLGLDLQAAMAVTHREAPETDAIVRTAAPVFRRHLARCGERA